ncbi:MAG: hypothetical protein M0Z54_00610 [Thermaerobacter sp.]|nr:hypothetical protein [Thermaerobacter sp.]
MKEQGIPFTEKEVTGSDATWQEMLQWTEGAPGTAVLLMGSQVLRGWRPDRLSTALGL